MLREKEVNKVNVFNYLQGHHYHVVQGVLQFLKTFNCGCEDLTEVLDGLENERLESMAKKAERMGTGKSTVAEMREVRRKKLKEVERIKRDLPDLHIVMGICPKCDSAMLGEPQKSCTKMVEGPVFYAECGACKYYYEMWKHHKTGKIRKEEGGV